MGAWRLCGDLITYCYCLISVDNWRREGISWQEYMILVILTGRSVSARATGDPLRSRAPFYGSRSPYRQTTGMNPSRIHHAKENWRVSYFGYYGWYFPEENVTIFRHNTPTNNQLTQGKPKKGFSIGGMRCEEVRAHEGNFIQPVVMIERTR